MRLQPWFAAISVLSVAVLVRAEPLDAQEVRVGGGQAIVAPAVSTGESTKAGTGAPPPTILQGPSSGPVAMPVQPGAGAGPGGPQGKPDRSSMPGGENKPGEGEKKAEEKSEPSTPAIQRPATPPKPGDPKELKTRPDAEGKIQFNFTNQKWLDVLEWFADISNQSLDWQELPGDYLNLITAEKYPLDEARDMINRHLLARGYTMLRRGEVLSVVKLDKLNPAMVPWVEPDQLDGRDPHEVVKVTFALDWLLAEQAAEELKPMVSQHGKLNPLKNTNRLEAMDAVVNLKEIRRILSEEQSDTGEGRLVAPFVLKHTRAAEVRSLLMQLLGIEDKTKAPGAGQPQPGMPGQAQPEMRQPRPDQPQQPGKPEKKEPEVNIVADERTNTIYVHAPPDKIAVIRQAIEAIDVPIGRMDTLSQNVTRMKVYRLESLDPEPVLKTLKDLGGLGVDARMEVDKQNKAIVAYASLADHVIIASVIDKLDGGARHSEVVQLTDLRAESVAKTVDYMMGGGPEEPEAKPDRSEDRSPFEPFFFPGSSSSTQRKRPEKHEDRFRVDADVKNNRLLLWCNDFEFAKVEQLLENLRTTQQAGGNGHSVQVHRLVSLDPEPLIKTLTEMETLGFGVKLEADKENKAIVAYAGEADHAKIRELITQLDGSGREFHVVPLRRLEADYVAGTVAFMMAGKEDEQRSGSGRSYYYYDYFGRRSSRDQRKKEDEFRVDADVEFNRLLLWANAIEMEEVKNLLVKLGEIPPEGGNPNSIRILDVPSGPERDRLFEQLRRIWPSLAPNPLVLPPPEPPKDESRPEPQKQRDDERPGKTPTTSRARLWPGRGGGERPPLMAVAQVNPATPSAALPQNGSETPAGAGQQGLDAATAGDTAKAERAPVRVSLSADGRLIISSEDTRALDQIETLIGELAPSRRDYQVFQLKYAEAYWVALTLEDFFEEKKKGRNSEDDYWAGWWGMPPSSSSDDGARRLSRRKPLKFISDDTTNTILVQGATPDQLRTIGELVELYDRPAMSDSDSARTTEIFKIRYAKAGTVAEAIKDVYRDLLSENDKALLGAKKKDEDRPESRYTYIYSLGGEQEKGLERKPRFKGYLSLGVDETSNTLVVSAPDFLFRDIARLIEEFDEAARPTADTIRVHKLSGGVDREDLRRRLSKILEGPAVRAGEAKEKPAEGASPAAKVE
ncbi:MAG: hypothetical protein HUU20_18285 [Pirellulales bacterium]|nr:hypothetical protein [Pirellulales bacterium]